jgi:membrane associated rhomboid family serine protease
VRETDVVLLPVYDRNPLKIIPFQFVTISLIFVTVLIFLWQVELPPGLSERAILVYGVVPSVLFGAEQIDPRLAPIPAHLTLLTSLFLHGDWWHLIGNMLFLWVFGDNIEDATGHWKFLLFYLICGIAAGFAHAVAMPDLTTPTVGASGAVAGLLGAYIMLHPRVKILVLAMKWFPIYLPAYLVLALWFGFQLFSVWLGGGGQVAWWAHIGGFVAGAVLIVFFRDERVPLFDRGVTH